MQQCNLQLVVCVNQSHHNLKLARQWEFPICSACARWVLFQINFRPQKEIKAKLGDGQTFHSGPSFARLQYILIGLLLMRLLHITMDSNTIDMVPWYSMYYDHLLVKHHNSFCMVWFITLLICVCLCVYIKVSASYHQCALH